MGHVNKGEKGSFSYTPLDFGLVKWFIKTGSFRNLGPEEMKERTFQSDDFGGRVHDGRVGSDGSTNGIVGIGQVDDDNLGRFTHLLPDTDELV